MRTVVLLGAGFPTIWGGKITSELTKTLEDQISDEWIPEYQEVYQNIKLTLEPSHRENFEELISKLEYISKAVSNDSSNELFYELFEPIILRDNAVPYAFKSFYSGSSDWSCFNPSNNPRFITSKFFEYYLNELKDAWSYDDDKLADSCTQSNLQEFLSHIKKEGVLRAYSLNYDCELQKEFQLFDGFKVWEDGKMVADNNAILLDTERNSCFNLHGSWCFHERFSSLDTIEAYGRMEDFGTCNTETFSQNHGAGEQIYYGIVSGENKGYGILKPPLNYYFNAFQNDLAKADCLIIIGYSFSDEHINRAILDLAGKETPLLIVDHAIGDAVSIKLDLIRRNLIRSNQDPWKRFHSKSNGDLHSDWKSNCHVFLGGTESFLERHSEIMKLAGI